MNSERHLGNAAAGAADPGWYDDPSRAGGLRRWDGERWTADTRPPRAASTPTRRVRLERLQMAFAATSLVLFLGVAVALVVIGPARLHGVVTSSDDVAAARACATFRRFLDTDPARSDPSHPIVVMRPRLVPRFSGLANDIEAAERAAQLQDSAALLRAGNDAIARCATLSPAAKAAGKFTR